MSQSNWTPLELQHLCQTSTPHLHPINWNAQFNDNALLSDTSTPRCPTAHRPQMTLFSTMSHYFFILMGPSPHPWLTCPHAPLHARWACPACTHETMQVARGVSHVLRQPGTGREGNKGRMGVLQTGLASTLGAFLFPFTSCFLFELNLCTAVLMAIQHRHHAYLVSLTQ